MSKSWKVINEIIGKSKTMHNSSKFNINGNPTDDEAVISNSFNNYFIQTKIITWQLPSYDYRLRSLPDHYPHMTTY